LPSVAPASLSIGIRIWIAAAVPRPTEQCLVRY
jgi:hypothetical protein